MSAFTGLAFILGIGIGGYLAYYLVKRKTKKFMKETMESFNKGILFKHEITEEQINQTLKSEDVEPEEIGKSKKEEEHIKETSTEDLASSPNQKSKNNKGGKK